LDVRERDDANRPSLAVDDGCAADRGERRLLEEVGDVVLFADQQRRVSIGQLGDESRAARSPLELADAWLGRPRR